MLTHDQLNSIPVDSWADAADTLTEETSYHMKVEWPGMFDQIQLYQVTSLSHLYAYTDFRFHDFSFTVCN